MNGVGGIKAAGRRADMLPATSLQREPISMAASSVLRPNHGELPCAVLPLKWYLTLIIGVAGVVIGPVVVPGMPVEEYIHVFEQAGSGHERLADAKFLRRRAE